MLLAVSMTPPEAAPPTVLLQLSLQLQLLLQLLQIVLQLQPLQQPTLLASVVSVFARWLD